MPVAGRNVEAVSRGPGPPLSSQYGALQDPDVCFRVFLHSCGSANINSRVIIYCRVLYVRSQVLGKGNDLQEMAVDLLNPVRFKSPSPEANPNNGLEPPILRTCQN